jgi:hypothetical protein
MAITMAMHTPITLAQPVAKDVGGLFGLPQLGHVGASELISFPHSLHLMSAMIVLHHNRAFFMISCLLYDNRASLFVLDQPDCSSRRRNRLSCIRPGRLGCKCSLFLRRESIDSVQTERAAREKILFERCRDSSRRRIAPRGVVSRLPFRGVYFLAPRSRSIIEVLNPAAIASSVVTDGL